MEVFGRKPVAVSLGPLTAFTT